MIAIANTDLDWFEFHRQHLVSGTVNFWTPTPWRVRRLDPGDRFYFMLKTPIRKVGGFGLFREYREASAEGTWLQWGTANGVANRDELTSRLSKYVERRTVHDAVGRETIIGSIILDGAVFFDEAEFIELDRTPLSFPRQIVKLKYFADVEDIDVATQSERDSFSLVGDTSADYQNARSKRREGQSRFREHVLSAYQRRCCITGETVEEVLEAAHIEPYVNASSNHVQNGIPLRRDLHKLYDAQLLSIDEQGVIHVSTQVRSEAYQSLDGKLVLRPLNVADQPSVNAVRLRRGWFRH